MCCALVRVRTQEMTQLIIDTLISFWQSTPIKLWLGFLIVGLVVERIAQAEKNQPLKDLWFNGRYGVLYLIVIFVVSPTLYASIYAIAATTGTGWLRVDVFSETTLAGQIGAGAVSLLITDFFYYWLHRAQHKIDWLWQQHILHHSEVSLNVSTSMRHHWLEPIFQGFAIALPMSVIFKMTPVSMWTVSVVVAGWSWFIHMNVRLHLGRFGWLVAAPQVHRIHHSLVPEHLNHNFAAYFPVWDVLFGTYYRPQRDEYPPTGVSGIRIKSVTRAFFYPLAQWTKSNFATYCLHWNRLAFGFVENERKGLPLFTSNKPTS